MSSPETAPVLSQVHTFEMPFDIQSGSLSRTDLPASVALSQRRNKTSADEMKRTITVSRSPKAPPFFGDTFAPPVFPSSLQSHHRFYIRLPELVMT
jgi:hypothetical protein